ncbi:MAG: DUF2505 domain-containing protein [Bifidobacteriaceae bacterium]|jgi:hypothetical protein|nr:DUF2505 domain-containing protein [Bifidobacteriaceae bacterium]
MRFAARYDYPVPPARVAALLADRAHLLKAAEAAGAESSQVDVSPKPDDGLLVTVRSTIPTADLPAALRGFLPQGLELRQAVVWEAPAADGSRRATMAGEVPGAGVNLAGSVRLSPTAAGCRLQFAGDVKAQLPLLGRAVEDAAVPAIVKILDAQHQVTLDRLDG